MIPPWSARQLMALFAATVIPRALLALFLGIAGEPERWEYDLIAANIANGNGHVYDRLGFVYAAYAPPVWSYVLAALLSLGGGTRISIQILQSLFCFGSAVLYGGLARRVAGDDWAGLVTGFMVAFQPSLLYYSVAKSDPLPLNVFLLGLIAVSGIALVTTASDRHAIMFGLLVALGVLSRGTPIAALPVVTVAFLVRWRLAALRPVAMAALSFTLSIAPWLARNAVVVGAPIITSTTGENFWRGNHEGAGGGVQDLNGGEITRLAPANLALPEKIRAVLAKGTELERHQVFMAEAWRFIRARPEAAMELLGRKLRGFWWKIDSDPRGYPPMASLAYEVIYRTELALALLGALVLFRTHRGTATRPDRMAAGLVVALMAAISGLQCAFYFQGRHRFLIEPLVLSFTAWGTLWMVTAASGLRSPRANHRSRSQSAPEVLSSRR